MVEIFFIPLMPYTLVFPNVVMREPFNPYPKKSTKKSETLEPEMKRAPPTGGARPKIVRSSLYYRTMLPAAMISPVPPIVRSAMPSPFVSPKIVQVDAPVTEMTSSPAVPLKAVTTVKA